MLILKIPILVLSILFAVIGVYLAVRINISKKKIDPVILRARVFLNDSFINESWKLILIALILFIIHAFIELKKVFGTVTNDEVSWLIDDIIMLGILICIIIVLNKWLKLMNPQNPVLK